MEAVQLIAQWQLQTKAVAAVCGATGTLPQMT